MKQTDIVLLQQCLRDDIEILLEEFEDTTGKRVSEIQVVRIAIDESDWPKFHKRFEYLVKVI